MFDVPTIKQILRKATAVNSKPTPETFPELPTVLVWFRCLLALAYGTYLGTGSDVRLRGLTMMLHTLNLIAFIPVMYCRLFLGTNEGYGLSLVTSGLLPALALALLIWIYMFTAAQEEAEQKLSTLLLSTVTTNETDPILAVDTSAVGEESEF